MVVVLSLIVMMMVVVLVMTSLSVVKVGVRMSPVMVVVFGMVRAVTVIMRRVSPIQLVFSSYYFLQTLPRLLRR